MEAREGSWGIVKVLPSVACPQSERATVSGEMKHEGVPEYCEQAVELDNGGTIRGVGNGESRSREGERGRVQILAVPMSLLRPSRGLPLFKGSTETGSNSAPGSERGSTR